MNSRTESYRWTLGLALLTGLVLCSWLARPLTDLQIRVSDRELLPAGSDVLAADEAARKTFGSDDRLMIAFESRQGTVTDPVFREDLRFFLSKLAESHNINLFLFDRLYRGRFQLQPVAGEPYWLHTPDPAWIEAALNKTAVTGQIATGRSRRTVFLETPAFSGTGVEDIERQTQKATQALEARRPGAYRTRLIGRQVVLNGLGEAIVHDLKVLLPWCFLLIGLLFWLLFRSWVLVALSVFQSGLTVVLTLAILPRLGHPLSLMTAMIPVLITVLGIADEIHFFGEFLRLRAVYPERSTSSLAFEVLRRVFFPCTAITLTTVIGFASFLATDSPALRVFGFLAGIGIGISWLISVTLVPAVLALVPIQARPKWSERSWSLDALDATMPLWRNRAVPILLSLVLIPGIVRLRVDDGWTRNFRPDHPIVQDVRWFEKESVGLYQFDLMLERKDGRSWTEPELLAVLEKLEDEVRATPDVTASLSLADLVRDRAWELGDPAAARPPLPASRPEIERILSTYQIFNEQILERMFLHRSHGATRLIFAASKDDYRTATRVRRTLDETVRRHFDPRLVEARIGGSAERGRVLIESIVSSQSWSVGTSLLLSLLVLGIASGRWGRSLWCIAANVWALLLTLGAAGWLGIEMGVATSSFLAVGVGVGLDYGIHLAFHRQSEEGGDGAVFLRVLANVLVVGAGLAVLMLSANPTIARLGFLLVTSMAA
ncbi:MAG TPA: MMPL family transporter, partial [Thermoanaerobaculia bacterium]|nr:MMPL family transporter [Thermoanaerobaculia bacterium]